MEESAFHQPARDRAVLGLGSLPAAPRRVLLSGLLAPGTCLTDRLALAANEHKINCDPRPPSEAKGHRVSKAPLRTPAPADVEKLLEGHSPEVRQLAAKTRQLVREIAPDAGEEIDWTAKMIGSTFLPGTYKGLILTISPAKKHVSIIFSKGVELLEAGLDENGLLEGTGKKARHIKVHNEEILYDPMTRKLIEGAVERTPRDKP